MRVPPALNVIGPSKPSTSREREAVEDSLIPNGSGSRTLQSRNDEKRIARLTLDGEHAVLLRLESMSFRGM